MLGLVGFRSDIDNDPSLWRLDTFTICQFPKKTIDYNIQERMLRDGIMASRTISTLKFVGTISLGLLTGVSYTLSTLTLPTLLTLPTASSASRAFTNLTTLSLHHLDSLAGVSSISFFLAYILSPRSQKHPYLIWASLFSASSAFGLTDYILSQTRTKKVTSPRDSKAKRDTKGKGRQMDASYEVLGDSNSEGTASSDELEEGILNGEEVREQMEEFVMSQALRTAVAGLGFAMSVIGIWGDGAADVVVIEM
ncbi:hypothetical protein B7494_g2140 [Chlorociboria aeruginascens]|nr:hypothetical protein B7494_g2140 [Chlorociboria aeruginascens]